MFSFRRRGSLGLPTRGFWLRWLAAAAISWGAAAGSDDFPAPYNSGSEQRAAPPAAEAALAGLRVPEGFQVRLVAAEPEVQNPIAMAWDARGRLWVAENYTYAERRVQFDHSLRDRLLIFEDTDGDGWLDHRKVFADDLQLLTSVETGHGGVWLMCPPRLLFVPDADGDDRPDGAAHVLLDGFTVSRDNYHNFANGLRWGPDGWLYGRCGHSCPGRIGLPGTPHDERLPLRGGIWRYHPGQQRVEVLCHGTVNSWGHDWDRQGELFFINTVIGHVWHMMPGAHFKESFGESPNAAVYERMDTIADHYHFDTRRGWAASRDGSASDLGGGHAHVGMMIYQATQWPEEYRQRLFTWNMHGRRVNMESLERQGAGYVARHAPDFLRAEDPWFRGMDLSVGPDGSVYLLDWSDTGECHEHTGVHRTSGRIYCVSFGPPRPAAAPRRPWCVNGDGTLPRLWRQYQAGQATPTMLRGHLRHEDEHVRAWAIRLLTDFWPLDTQFGPLPGARYPHDPELLEALTRMAREDNSGLVQLVLASTLQRLPVAEREALGRALIGQERHAHDRDLPLLVWYGLAPLGERDPQAMVRLAQACRWPVMLRWMSRQLATQLDTRPEALNALLVQAGQWPPQAQRMVLQGMSQALQGWRQAPQPVAWEEFAASSAADHAPEMVRELSGLFGDGRALDELRKLALDASADVRSRQAALRTLIEAQPPDLRLVCQSLLDVRAVNGLALRGLALFDDEQVGRQLAARYHDFHPEDRPALIDALVSRRSFAQALLHQMGEPRGGIPAADLSAHQARAIRNLGDAQLTEQLRQVWGAWRESPAEKQARMAELRAALSAEVLAQADLVQGRIVYGRLCIQCHPSGSEGGRLGPDLTGAQRDNLDYLLEHVVDPQAMVPVDYRMSVLLLHDGRVLSGIVSRRDARTVTLETPQGSVSLAHDAIEEQTDLETSLMPDHLLQGLSMAEIRDLFGYLMQAGR